MGQIAQKIPEKWKIKYYLVDKDTGVAHWHPSLSSKVEYKVHGNTKYERTKCAVKMLEGFIEKYLKPNQEVENALICEVGFNGVVVAQYDKNSKNFMYY